MRLGFDDHLKENIILSFSVVLCEHSFVSIVLNGGMHGFFKGKRGIRQEDPISPLLFVIVMEYLTRLLRKIGKLRGFKFHSRWKIIGQLIPKEHYVLRIFLFENLFLRWENYDSFAAVIRLVTIEVS